MDSPFTDIADFRRVAIHELGHTIGLNHEDDVPAIMQTSVPRGSTTLRPTADDIAGVEALYDLPPSQAPEQPTLLSPSNGATGISLDPTLIWSTTSGASSYDVYFGTDLNPPFVGSTTTTAYDTGTLVSNQTYYWWVAATNSAGTTASLSTFNFTTVDLRPAQPALLSPSSRETDVSLTPTLSWSPADGATSYDVYFGPALNPPLVQNTTDTSFTPGTLDPNQTYYWWVKARNSFGTRTSQFQFLFTTLLPIDSAARSFHVFPQMVDGLGWTSFLLATNPGTEGTVCNFAPKGGLNASRLVQSGEFFLPPDGGSWLVFTKATASVAVGYATLDCTQPVTAQLTYINEAGATIVSMATVPSSDAARSAQLQFLNFTGFRTAFAIANDSASPISCDVTISHVNTTPFGNRIRVVQGTVSIVVEPKTNLARFADEIVSLDPSVGTGLVEMECSDSVHAVGLVFNGSSFSTAPVTILDRTESTAKAFHVFPQMVDGVGWTSFLLATNPGTEGTACNFIPKGGLEASRLAQSGEFLLPPDGGSWLIFTNATASVAVGYATLDCTQPVTAQLTYINQAGATIVSMATVPSSDSARSAQLQFLNFTGFRTAFAIANESDSTISCDVTISHVTSVLGSSVRVVQGTVGIVVEPKTNLARFADEIVSLNPAVGTGLVEIECSGSFQAVGLLFNGSSFSTAPATILVPG